MLLAGLVAPVWLDVIATAGMLDDGVMPTAAAAAGAVLMPVAAVRGSRIPLAAATAIAAVLVAEALMQIDTAGITVVPGVAVALSAVFPVLIATLAISGFRRLVGRELDLSLVQSTVGTSRSAVGMRASEELAQLDFDAETLLDDVGSGRIAIPLPPDAAELAGSLAARLRVRLIEGRTDTWLRHAVTESAYLSHRVTVDDQLGSAGLLVARSSATACCSRSGSSSPSIRSGGPAPDRARLVPRAHPSRDRIPKPDSTCPSTCREWRDDVWTPRRGTLSVVSENTMSVTGADGFRIDIACRVTPNVNAGSGGPWSRSIEGELNG